MEHGVRETMSICPMYLTYKDHKGWSWEKGTPPPTRPIAAGNVGMNLHLSEILSEVTEAVANCWEDSKEVISTEDMIARLHELNKRKKDWTEESWWEKKGKLKEGSLREGREKMNILLKERGEGGTIDSREVPRDVVQDFTAKMVCVGFDVEALYPSMDYKEVARLVEEAVNKSNINWTDLDYQEGARWIALNYSEEWCRASKLYRVLPRRRAVNGTRPEVGGTGPQGKETGDTEQWIFPDVILSEEEKKMIVGATTRLMIEILFKNHIYTFGGKMFRQEKGGPIGLRGTCAVARVVMNIWDREWERELVKKNVELEELVRYMDDGRTFLHPINKGWRWTKDSITYKKEWEEEDVGMSDTERTRRILEGQMQQILKCLKFTTETEEDFEGGWLPTLDLEIKVHNNRVSHRYYEKPTTTRTTVKQRSAMEERNKMKILSNDMVRRLLNSMEDLGKEERERVVDGYGQKLLNSGYQRKQVIKILVAGIRGYERKLRRCKIRGDKLYRTSKESYKNRQIKKLVGAKDWYRGNRRKNSVKETEDWNIRNIEERGKEIRREEGKPKGGKVERRLEEEV